MNATLITCIPPKSTETKDNLLGFEIPLLQPSTIELSAKFSPFIPGPDSAPSYDPRVPSLT